MGHSYFKKCVDFKFKYSQVSCILFCSHAWFVPSPSLVRSRLSYHGRSCFLVAISVCREQLCSRDLTEQPHFCFSLVFSSTKHHKEGLLWSQGATAGDQQASFSLVFICDGGSHPTTIPQLRLGVEIQVSRIWLLLHCAGEMQPWNSF